MDDQAKFCGKCGSEFIENAEIITGNIIKTRWGDGGVGTVVEVDIGESQGIKKDDIGRIVGADNRNIALVRISDAFEDHSTVFVTEVMDTTTIVDTLSVQFVGAGKEANWRMKSSQRMEAGSWKKRTAYLQKPI